MRFGARIRTVGAAVLGTLILLIPSQVHAQDGFLFSRPSVTLSLYGGWAMPSEGSDVFDESRQELTLRQGDFNSPLGMAEVAFRVNERFDAALGVSHASRTARSEMRNFRWFEEGVDWEDLPPIRQSTEFTRTELMATGKYYLLPRGREVSRLAWVPYRWSPYVGGGAGVSWYEFVQAGDFAVALGDDPMDRDILELEVESRDRGFTAHALGGVQLSVTPRLLVRGEYRYIWGSADLDPAAFEGFDRIDLSGSNLLLGLSIRI